MSLTPKSHVSGALLVVGDYSTENKLLSPIRHLRHSSCFIVMMKCYSIQRRIAVAGAQSGSGCALPDTFTPCEEY
jgi:hypothetical protein